MASQRAGAPGPGGPHADPHAPASSLDGATAQVTAQDTAVGVDIGAGRLFVRPTPAQLLKGGDGGAGTTRKPQLHLAPGVEGEGHHQGGGPPRQPKSGKDALVTAGERRDPATQMKGQYNHKPGGVSSAVSSDVRREPPRVATGVETQPGEARAPSAGGSSLAAVQQDVQIGRLDPIPEGDEDTCATPREISLAEEQERTPAEENRTKPAATTSTGHSNSQRGGQVTTSRPGERQDTMSSPLQNLPLVKLDHREKKARPVHRVESNFGSLQEADKAREREVLRRQQVLETNRGLPSAGLPFQIEDALVKGVSDPRPVKRPVLPEEELPDATSEKHPDQSVSTAQAVSGSQNLSWTEFASERTKELGHAVDDADSSGKNEANILLKPEVHDVLLWLRNIGWGQYEEAFAINQIDFDELFSLTDTDLQDMGMKLKANRHMLLNAIASLRQGFKNDRSELGVAKDHILQNQNVFIHGHDKREGSNSALIADQVIYKQKSGYVTWGDHGGKKWKRGYAVIQGSSLHIFKSSDHVVLKPLLSHDLHGSLISQSSRAQNCIYIQINSMKVSTADIYLCAPDGEEQDSWLQHLVAAANLQVLQHVLTKETKRSLPPIIIMIDEFVINKTGPRASPRLELRLIDKNGTLVTKFNDVRFPDLVDDVAQPSPTGCMKQILNEQLTLHKKLRAQAGPGSIIFFEFKHSAKDKWGANMNILTQYWAYAFVDDLRTGNVRLDLMKKPPVYDPLLLQKGSLPKKEKSFVGLTVSVKDVQNTKPVPDVLEQNDGHREFRPNQVRACCDALLGAIRSKCNSSDQETISSMKHLEAMLGSLHIMDGLDTVDPGTWHEISSKIVTSAASLLPAVSGKYLGNDGTMQPCQTSPEAHGKMSPDVLSRGEPTISQLDAIVRPPPPPPPPNMVVSKYVQIATAEYAGPSPGVRMRPFHWKKVPPNESPGTIWTNVQEQEWNEIVGKLEPRKIEILFSASQSSNSGAILSLPMKRRQTTALIDLRRAQNVSIMLSQFRCTFSEIRQAILDMNSAFLDIDRTEELLKFVPTVEEIEILRNYSGDLAGLGSPERFFLEIADIPRYKERLQVHLLILTFDNRNEELVQNLRCLIKCLTELTNCKRLHRFMLHLLAVGNFMNQGTSMGKATAFRLEALNQAVNIRSNVEGVTLLHFLASHIHNTDSDLLNLPMDLASADRGSAVSLPALKTLKEEMEKDLSVAISEHQLSRSKDVMKKVLSGFLPHAKKKMKAVDLHHVECESLLKGAKAMYAEAASAINQQEFCRVFATFRITLETVIHENQAARSNLKRRSEQSHDAEDETLAHDSTLQPDFTVKTTAPAFVNNYVRSPIEDWLVQNHLEDYSEVLKLNRVTIDDLLELNDQDLDDLGITNVQDKFRMVKAIESLNQQHRSSLTPTETCQVKSDVKKIAEMPLPERTNAPAAAEGPTEREIRDWPPSQGQKQGWVHVQTRSKKWEKFYAKRAKNNLVLFLSDDCLQPPARRVCLDGMIVSRSQDKHRFVVEARKSIFQETKDDVILCTDSEKDATSWEKALIKASLWHADGRRATQNSSSAAAGVQGLRPAEIQSVGRVFTYKSSKASNVKDEED